MTERDTIAAPMTPAELDEAERVIAYRHPQGLSLTAHGERLVRVSTRLLAEVRRLRNETHKEAAE